MKLLFRYADHFYLLVLSFSFSSSLHMFISTTPSCRMMSAYSSFHTPPARHLQRPFFCSKTYPKNIHRAVLPSEPHTFHHRTGFCSGPSRRSRAGASSMAGSHRSTSPGSPQPNLEEPAGPISKLLKLELCRLRRLFFSVSTDTSASRKRGLVKKVTYPTPNFCLPSLVTVTIPTPIFSLSSCRPVSLYHAFPIPAFSFFRLSSSYIIITTPPVDGQPYLSPPSLPSTYGFIH